MAKQRIAIVTGASAGLGREFARQAEREFTLDEIWLVARRAEPMEKLAAEFKRAQGVVIALDLALPADVARLGEHLRAAGPEVVLLVNNAGFGKIGAFAEIELESQLGEIDVNVRALTAVTHLALPYMGKNSHILQIASSIGFAPAPKFAVYAATKAYVVSFSYALREELKARGVNVTAVCPGPVATEFQDVALPPGAIRSFAHRNLAAEAAQVVDLAYYDLKAGRAVSIYGWSVRAFVLAARLLPLALMTWLVGQRK